MRSQWVRWRTCLNNCWWSMTHLRRADSSSDDHRDQRRMRKFGVFTVGCCMVVVHRRNFSCYCVVAEQGLLKEKERDQNETDSHRGRRSIHCHSMRSLIEHSMRWFSFLSLISYLFSSPQISNRSPLRNNLCMKRSSLLFFDLSVLIDSQWANRRDYHNWHNVLDIGHQEEIWNQIVHRSSADLSMDWDNSS